MDLVSMLKLDAPVIHYRGIFPVGIYIGDVRVSKYDIMIYNQLIEIYRWQVKG